MSVTAQHQAFLQCDRKPWQRDGGLHGLLSACFPVDGRVDGTGPLLAYKHFLVRDDDVLELVLQLSWWNAGAIEAVAEEQLGICAIAPDVDVDELAEDLASRVYEYKTRAHLRIVHADRDITPADLIFSD